jgi:hypothetical protein
VTEAQLEACWKRADRVTADVRLLIAEVYRLRKQLAERDARDEAMTADEQLCKLGAREFARRGGSKGGKARAVKLTAEQRSAIARKAVETRWAKKRAEGEVTP